MEFNTTVYLSPLAYVEVGVRWGKFIKLVKNGKWLYLSEANYKLLKENLLKLNESHEKNSEFELQFNSIKSVKADSFRFSRTTTFCEHFEKDGSLFKKYVQFNAREWEAFNTRLAVIDSYLAYDEALGIDGGLEWSLLEHPNGYGDEVGSKQRCLVPRMCDAKFYFCLQRYLLVQGIRNLQPTVCGGCINDSTDENLHSKEGEGCRAPPHTMIPMLFDNVNDTIIDLMSAADNVYEALKWTKENSGSEFPSFSDETKKGMVCEENKFDCAHDDCKRLTEVYERTFDSVFSPASKLFK